MKAVGQARREEARGGSRTHFPPRQSSGTRASAHGTAKGIRRRETARSNAEESERNRIEGRFAGFAGKKSRFVLPSIPKSRSLSEPWLWRISHRASGEACFEGCSSRVARRGFGLKEGPNRNRPGPQGLGRNRIGKEPEQRCAGFGPDRKPYRNLGFKRCPEPQRRRLALTQGLDVDTGTVGAGREASPHYRLGLVLRRTVPPPSPLKPACRPRETGDAY